MRIDSLRWTKRNPGNMTLDLVKLWQLNSTYIYIKKAMNNDPTPRKQPCIIQGKVRELCDVA